MLFLNITGGTLGDGTFLAGEFNEEAFFLTLSRNVSPTRVAVSMIILEWSRGHGLRIWGGANSRRPPWGMPAH
ncbi:MAG: hypothetical protein WD314_02270 [Trueperaceae bacterium]